MGGEATIRDAEESEAEALARLWFAAWQDAHLTTLPDELIRIRTFDTFVTRMREGLGNVRAIGPVGAPIGFTLIKGDELNQIFVAREARGGGVAAALMADAEARLRDRGVQTAWLSCAIGNDRAARFYEKRGWRLVREMEDDLATPAGPFRLKTWRFEKVLTRSMP